MSALRSVSVIICVCCIACSIIGVIAPNGRMKKIVNLVFGAFIVVSIIIPLVGLADSCSADSFLDIESSSLSEPDDKAYEQMILDKTADNLVVAANELLLSENIEVNNIEVGIKKSENNSIYISRINIYISNNDKDKADKISNIITRNMSKEPVVIISE